MDRHYRVLGLERGAAEDDVKRAYRKRALQLHPDRNPTGAEAFKALQDAYEAALADVKRRGAGGYSAYAFSFQTSSFTTTGGVTGATAAASAGPGYRFARAAAGAASGGSNSSASASPPLFTEAELFGDGVPGGWRDSGARRAGDGGGASSSAAGRAAPQRRHTGGSAGSAEAAAADSHWRRAHGSRVPVSAYEGAGPMSPHPPPPPPQPPSATAAASTQGRAHQQPRTQQASPPTSPQQGEAEESAEDRAYREAMYLLRRMQDMASKDTDTAPARPPANGAQASTTAGAAGEKTGTKAECKAELHRQWKDMDATLRRKLAKTGSDASGDSSLSSSTASRQGPSGEHASSGNGSTPSTAQRENSKSASGAASPSGPSLGETWREVRQAHDQAHRETLLDERRALQREYMRYRYCPNPAEVGEMSDMEVYLLTSLMGEMQQRMHAVLDARLRKGPCSTCKEAPRAQAHRYFHCTHASVCEGCYAAGTLKCPLCGAPRASAQGGGDTAPASATCGGTVSPLSGAPPPTSSPAPSAAAGGVDGGAASTPPPNGESVRSAAPAPRHEPAVDAPPSHRPPADASDASPLPS